MRGGRMVDSGQWWMVDDGWWIVIHHDLETFDIVENWSLRKGGR